MGTDDQVDPCSKMYTVGIVGGVAWGFAIGGASGGAKGLYKPAGTAEWSHWIPARFQNVPGWIRNSGLNGNFRSAVGHALNDPYRYKFMPRAWKAANPINPAWLRQLDRIPDWLKFGGMTSGSAAA